VVVVDLLSGQEKAAVRSSMRTNEEHEMPGNPRDMITLADRRFPVRIRIGVPPGGLVSVMPK
jgi:hypothetical protein